MIPHTTSNIRSVTNRDYDIKNYNCIIQNIIWKCNKAAAEVKHQYSLGTGIIIIKNLTAAVFTGSAVKFLSERTAAVSGLSFCDISRTMHAGGESARLCDPADPHIDFRDLIPGRIVHDTGLGKIKNTLEGAHRIGGSGTVDPVCGNTRDGRIILGDAV